MGPVKVIHDIPIFHVWRDKRHLVREARRADSNERENIRMFELLPNESFLQERLHPLFEDEF
jgi:hypothetical protein